MSISFQDFSILPFDSLPRARLDNHREYKNFIFLPTFQDQGHLFVPDKEKTRDR